MNSSDIKEKFAKNKLKTRTYSGIVMFLITAIAIYVGGYVYTAFILLSTLMGMKEYSNITSLNKNWLLGFLYIAGFFFNTIYVRNSDNGLILIIFLYVIVAITDIGAYFCGIIIGGKKLAPTISPGKTLAGFIGALIFSVVIGGIFYQIFFVKYSSLFTTVIFTVIMSIASQLGDMAESFMKRKFGVKDSGTIIPGHGGILDRLDGLIAASYILLIIKLFI